MRAIFNYAKSMSPCVLFLDELDQLTTQRHGRGDSSADVKAKSIIREELDKLQRQRTHRVAVIGATNTPWLMDEGFIRRFNSRLYIAPPPH